MYATSEYLQAEKNADEILTGITGDLRASLPFLPSVFVVDAALQVLEVLVDDEDTKREHIDALFDLVEDGFQRGGLGDDLKSLRKRLGRVDRRRTSSPEETCDETEKEEDFDEDDDEEDEDME